MEPEEYLHALRHQLKDFPENEQRTLIEEIISHMESGEEDSRMGKDREARRHKMMSELGSPRDLGRQFNNVHRPGRWVDFLLVAIPYLLYPLVNVVLENVFGLEYVARAEILLYSILIFAGIWRRSNLLTVFWITQITGQIAAMLFVGWEFYGTFQSLLWLILGVGLLVWLGQMCWSHREDLLFLVYVGIPLLACLYGLAFVWLHPSSAGMKYGLLDQVLLDLYVNGGNSGYLPYVGMIISMALFYLSTSRSLRWLALALYGFVYTISRAYLNLGEMMAPWVYSLYLTALLFLPPLGWLAEKQRSKRTHPIL